MPTYKSLEKEFKKKVKELQEKCKHLKTEWAEEWWAIAHSTGFAVQYCKACNKKLKRIPIREAYDKGYLKEYKRAITYQEMKKKVK